MLSREEEVSLEVARYQAALFLPGEEGTVQRQGIANDVDRRAQWAIGPPGGPRPVDAAAEEDRVGALRRRYREQRRRRRNA